MLCRQEKTPVGDAAPTETLTVDVAVSARKILDGDATTLKMLNVDAVELARKYERWGCCVGVDAP